MQSPWNVSIGTAWRMRRARIGSSSVLALAGVLLSFAFRPPSVHAQGTPLPASNDPTAGPAAWSDTAAHRVLPNDNRYAAGELRDGKLAINLEAREGLWGPEGEHGPALRVYAFGEVGRGLSAPGPLIRVPVGTVVQATIYNRLARPLVVWGFQSRPVAVPAGGQPVTTLDSVAIEPGGTRAIRFTTAAAGTYYYYGRTRPPMGRGPIGPAHPGGDGGDGTLVGALIVDSAAPRAPDDRVFVITKWADPVDPSSMSAAGSKMMVNGLSWPYTERLRYAEGDTVRWRIINATSVSHPMHLHGFYFRVGGRGTVTGDTTYPAEQQRSVVTELLHATTTMSVAWVPEREGNWLFHCHLIRHMAPTQRIGGQPHPVPTGGTPNHARDLMAGLVLGIEVAPKPGSSGPEADPPARRPLRLHASTRARVYGNDPGYGFVLEEGPGAPAPDSIRVPGTPLILRRNEPVAITVRNRLPTPLSVHWHGIELESYFDGVGDWSGSGGRIAPPIPPGDSFVVHITPKRAGTFIYHTHGEHSHELVSGLYGPLLVLDPGEVYDPESDRTFVLSAGGPSVDAAPLLNGSSAPPPIRLVSGRKYRFRFIQISADDEKTVSLLENHRPVAWQPRGKDGEDLPAGKRKESPARFTFGPGETYDFEYTAAAPGRMVLRVQTVFYPGARRAPAVMEVSVEVH